MKKRIVSALLLAALLLSSAACSNTPENTDKETPDAAPAVEEVVVEEEVDETDFTPNVPDADFGGADFRFVQVSTPSYAYKLATDLLAEELTGDVINDAIFNRNTFVEDKYKIKVCAQYTDGFGQVQGIAVKAFAAGDDNYEVFNERLYEVPNMIGQGVCIDLNKVPYIDFSQPWWDHSCIESTAILHKNYIAASDIYLSDKYATAAVLFSKDMASAYNIENLYDVVKEGRWTIDYIRSVSENVSNDMNGDGKMDAEDFYGILGRRDMTMFFFHGTGSRLAELDENGIPVDVFYTDRNVSAIEKMFTFFYDQNIFFNVHTRTSLGDSDFYTLFRDGHSLFYVGMMLEEVGKLRECEFDFGIIPNPKYDEEQANYYSTVSVHHTGLLSVPAICGRLEMVGTILEAMGAKSKQVLQPAYYETALKGKFARDSESSDMLDIIFANRVFDVGDIMGFGGLSIDFYNITTDDIASFYQKHQKLVSKQIEKYVKTLEELP